MDLRNFNTQQVAAIVGGIIAGHTLGARLGRIVKNNNIQRPAKPSYNTKPIRIGAKDAVTIKYGTVLGVRGQISTIGVYLTNNTRNNSTLGVAGFNAALNFDPSLVTFLDVTADGWIGELIVDSTKASTGFVKLDARQTTNIMDDRLLVKVRFTVKSTVPLTIAKIPITHSGTGTDTAGTVVRRYMTQGGVTGYFLVSPIGMEQGSIELDSIPYKIPPTITTPGEVGVVLGGTSGGASATVDFTLGYTLSGPVGAGGVASGSGYVWASIGVYVDGVKVGSTRIKLPLGSNRVSGAIPMIVPDSTVGDVTYEIVIEPEPGEEDLYYIFIPEFGFITVVNSQFNPASSSTIPDPNNYGSARSYFFLSTSVLITLVELEVDMNVLLNTTIKLVNTSSTSDMVDTDSVSLQSVIKLLITSSPTADFVDTDSLSAQSFINLLRTSALAMFIDSAVDMTELLNTTIKLAGTSITVAELVDALTDSASTDVIRLKTLMTLLEDVSMLDDAAAATIKVGLTSTDVATIDQVPPESGTNSTFKLATTVDTLLEPI